MLKVGINIGKTKLIRNPWTFREPTNEVNTIKGASLKGFKTFLVLGNLNFNLLPTGR